MNTTIRIAEDKEVLGLKTMIREGYPYPYEDTADQWLIAERGGEVIGCIGMEKPNSGYPCLSPLMIKATYQKGLVAYRLIKMAEFLYRQANVPGYIFGIRKDNERMKKMSNRYAILYREDPEHLYYGVDFHAKQKKTAQT